MGFTLKVGQKEKCQDTIPSRDPLFISPRACRFAPDSCRHLLSFQVYTLFALHSLEREDKNTRQEERFYSIIIV